MPALRRGVPPDGIGGLISRVRPAPPPVGARAPAGVGTVEFAFDITMRRRDTYDDADGAVRRTRPSVFAVPRRLAYP